MAVVTLSLITQKTQAFVTNMAWQALISPITNLVGGYLNNKHEQAQAKHHAKLQVIQNDADWESKMADASANSWKDEWLTILFSVPLILAFCGEWGRQIVTDGFTALNAMPEYYRYTLGIIVSASFGTRAATKFFGKK